jgi:hypothetical protein
MDFLKMEVLTEPTQELEALLQVARNPAKEVKPTTTQQEPTRTSLFPQQLEGIEIQRMEQPSEKENQLTCIKSVCLTSPEQCQIALKRLSDLCIRTTEQKRQILEVALAMYGGMKLYAKPSDSAPVYAKIISEMLDDYPSYLILAAMKYCLRSMKELPAVAEIKEVIDKGLVDGASVFTRARFLIGKLNRQLSGERREWWTEENGLIMRHAEKLELNELCVILGIASPV